MLSMGGWVEINVGVPSSDGNKYAQNRIEGILQDCFIGNPSVPTQGGLYDTVNACYMKDFGQYKVPSSTLYQRAITIAGAATVSLGLLGTALGLISGLHLAFVWFRAPFDSFFIRAYRLFIGFIASVTSCLFLAAMTIFHIGLRLSTERIPYAKLATTTINTRNGYYIAWACVGASILAAWVLLASTCCWAIDYVNCKSLAAAFHPTCSQRASALSMTNGIRTSMYSLNNDGVWLIQDPPTLPRYITTTYGDGEDLRSKAEEPKIGEKEVNKGEKANTMEATNNTENVTSSVGKALVKQTNEEPKETVVESKVPKTDEIGTNKSTNKEKLKSVMPTVKPVNAPPSSSGDTEARQPRVRKQVQRLSDMWNTSYTKEKEAKEKAFDEVIAKGSGTPLGEIPLIEASIKKFRPVDLKLLHYACFGRGGTMSEVRSNLRKFSGFSFNAKSDEYTRRDAALNKKPVKEIQDALRQLHLEVSGTRTQIVTRLLEFLLKPEASAVKYKGKLPPSKRGRKSKADSASNNKKTFKSGRKSKASKESEEEREGNSDGEQEESEPSETEEKSEAISNASDKEASDSDDDFSPAGDKKQKKKAAGKKKSAPKKRRSTVTSKSATAAKRRKRTNIETESEKEEEEDALSDLEESGDEKSEEEKIEEKSGDKQNSDDDDDKPLAKVSSSATRSDEEESGGTGNKSAATQSSKPAESENESAPFPSDEELREKTLELLRNSNLNEVSMKSIRQSLADLYPSVDLSSKKDYLNGVIKRYLITSASSGPHSVIAYRSINEFKREKPCWKATLVSPWFYISTVGFLIALGTGLYVYSQSKLKPIDIVPLEVVKCPACFGQSMCPAFFSGGVRLPTFYGSRPIHSTDFEKFDGLTEVDLGMLERKLAVLRQLYLPSTSSAVDVEVCRRQRLDDFQVEAPLPRCIPRLSIWRWMATDGPGTSDPVDVDIVRNMSVFTRCASPRLLRLIQSRYRERSSNRNLPPQKSWLRFDELTLLFNLAINPHALIATVFPPNEGWPFPLQLGACGRMTLEKGTSKPLSLFINASVKTRLRILRSLLQIPSKLESNSTLVDPETSDFALYLGDYRWDVFGVDPYTYHVSVIQARHVIAVDLLVNKEVKSPFVIDTNASYIQDACLDTPFATGAPCLSEEHVSGLCANNPSSDHNYWAVCMTAMFGEGQLVRGMARDILFSLEQCLKDAQDGARRSHIEAALEVISMELSD
nr:hypothetical protein HmN_000137000 [Hymenolepis microstoma]